MKKCVLVMSCHGLVVATAVALALWASGATAAATYDAATPHTPHRHKYIPIHGEKNREDISLTTDDGPPPQSSGMPISELILTALRTALDVVRNINKSRANTVLQPVNNSTALKVRRTRPTPGVSGRGFEDYYDEHHDHDHETTTTAKPMKQGRYTDPWAGYYDWIINEGSFKFWSVFQLFTAALLLYACFSAIYYAKFNPILPDYSMEYDDYFLERTVGRKARSLDSSDLPSGLSWINPTTFQFILDAISKHYEESE
ncbi:uncharacterized protein LOC121730145 [Aricia agestis]|uniref:uncharacterized protein LOC121730145 n=1 Tax=Aricia agestis TaxID=91739 RepID=UPI001C2079C9|nr:uncharacterized protein LOC121730145 [Aricia agestis]